MFPALCIVYPFFYMVDKFRPIRVGYIHSSRIGHLCVNTEMFLRKMQRGDYSKNYINIFIVGDAPIANHFLLKKYQEHINIIENNLLCFLLKTVVIYKTKFSYTLPDISGEYELFSSTKHTISLSDLEMDKGNALLKEMGVDNWFVCIFARDSQYLNELDKNKDFSYHSYRDFDIDTFEEAAKYIIEQGGFVVRIGGSPNKRFSFKHPKVIDYPYTEYRSEFMDMFLIANAKFVVGSNSGGTDTTGAFSTPLCRVNTIPIDEHPLCLKDIYVPKKLKKEGKFLLLNHYFNSIQKTDKSMYLSSDYIDLGMEIINNTPEEILEVTKEMNERLDGVFVEDDQMRERQNQYKKIHQRSELFGKAQSKIGSHFLQKNLWYIEE